MVHVAHYISQLWQGDPEAYGPRRGRKPCRYESYVPDTVGVLSPDFDSETATDLVTAEIGLKQFDLKNQSNANLEQLARFLLRAEAVASSRIEGLRIGSRRLAVHEAKLARGEKSHDATADSVLGNIRAMNLVVEELAAVRTLKVQHINELHRALMFTSPNPELGGELRVVQNWLGGNQFNPCNADFVPPPPEMVVELLQDLCHFMNRDDLPALAQAAITHAQFETIHPYIDGNGRTGRALIHVVLHRRSSVQTFVPPISLALATESARYVAGLMRYRYVGKPGSRSARDGLQDWLDVFIAATRRSVADAEQLSNDMTDLENQWRNKLASRRNSTAQRSLIYLLSHPVMAVEDLAEFAGVSFQAANNASAELVEAGIIKPLGSASRNRIFEATSVFELLTKYERSIATLSGDTSGEKPVRPVPDRMIRG